MIVTLTGASASGKSSIAQGLIEGFEAKFLTSYTTTLPQVRYLPGEYAYLTQEEFRSMCELDVFLWEVFVHGNHYGTSRSSVDEALSQDRSLYVMLLTIDKVAELLSYAREQRKERLILPCYILSDYANRRKRMLNRGDSLETVVRRLKDCLTWDSEAHSSGLPFVWVRNDGELENAVSYVKRVIEAKKRSLGI